MYKSVKHRLELYRQLDLTKVCGRIAHDISKEIKLLGELKFYENILVLYKFHTTPHLKNFLKILRTPIPNHRLDLLQEAEESKKKIFREYVNTLQTCIPYRIFEHLNLTDDFISTPDNENYCENCGNSENFFKENDVVICKNCYSEIIKMAYSNNRSYNFSVSKCNYDRISHFKDCLKQYQGKQNNFISPNVYSDLEKILYEHKHLIDHPEKEIRYKNVTKSHIMYYLKELGYTKHYDDYILIHSNLTGTPPNDISSIEDLLIADFEKISEAYTQLYSNIERKNFINIQVILYVLLIKHKHKFDSEDFMTIKSMDKKMERDNICKSIFEYLNWEYKCY